MTKYNADAYLRLSVDDGDKTESYSIANQRSLIIEYLKSATDIQLQNIETDDGYSGSDFNRPAFKSMLIDAEAGRINCIIVKDLSRLGRDYIECGKYIQRVFPRLGIRFISIGDHFDTIRDSPDDIMVSFRMLMDDYNLADISAKVRSVLDSKRKNGQFIGSFVTYGYKKAEHNKLVVDDAIASVVREIFNYKLMGLNTQGIANRLNQAGILSPMEYKKYCGLNFASSFKVNNHSKWSATAISRILKNEIYIGSLIQGKRATPNHRIKRMILKPENEWIKIEHNHDAIISKDIFERVQTLMQRDTRSVAVDQEVHLFSGLLFCPGCKQSMIRKETSSQSGKKYLYYICSTNRVSKKCSPHNIEENKLYETVLLVIQNHIRTIVEIEKIINFVQQINLQNKNVLGTNKRIQMLEKDLEDNTNFKMSLYQDMTKGILSKEDFDSFYHIYSVRCDEIISAITLQKGFLTQLLQNNSTQDTWLEKVMKLNDLTQLSRKILVLLVNKIYVFGKTEIEIVFNYNDEFECALSFMDHLKESGVISEVV